MTFDEAERKFRELQARVQRGEPISRADYEAMVAELAVQDDRGVLWEINPRTGKWMYFDGAEWVVGRPPGRDQSTVIPISQAFAPPPGATPPPIPRSQLAPSPTGATPPPTPAPTFIPPPRPSGATPPPMPKSGFTPPPQPRPTGATPLPQPRPGAAVTGLQTSAPPPESVQEGPGAMAGVQRPRVSSPFGAGNREWIPLAIAAVVLLFCAVVIFAVAVFNGGSLFGGNATRTPTRVAVRTATPVTPTIALPSPTLPPPTPAPVFAKINVTTANVRAGPSTSTKIVTTLKNGTQITLIGRSADSQWFQINVAGQAQPAWISIQVFQIAGGDPNSLPVPSAAATPTKQSLAPPPPAAALFSPTPTIIGAPTQTPTPTATSKP